MESHNEFDSCQTFICIKYTYADTQSCSSSLIHCVLLTSLMTILVISQKKLKANLKFMNKRFQDFLHHYNEKLCL